MKHVNDVGMATIRIPVYLEFMEAIADATRNPFISRFGETLMREHCRIVTSIGARNLKASETPEHIARSIASYEEIHAALVARDEERLIETVLARLEASRTVILAAIGL